MCDNIFAKRFVFHSHRRFAALQQLQLRFISLRSMARALCQLTLRMLRARVSLFALSLRSLALV